MEISSNKDGQVKMDAIAEQWVRLVLDHIHWMRANKEVKRNDGNLSVILNSKI